MSDNVLQNKENNFLAAVHFGKGAWGLSFLDISTGEYLIAEGPSDHIDKLLSNFAPKEVLIERGHRQQFCQSFGMDEGSVKSGNAYVDRVREAIRDENAQMLVIAARTESEIAELESYEDRQMFLEELGLEESGVNRLVKSAFSLLNLETFITAGPMEVKAWTYRKGWKAPQCAGVIHTDFEKGFIRAEVIKYRDYVELGSEAAVRDAGKLYVEGKDYVVQDGDIMHFRFNV